MKPLAILALTFALVTATATAALAHLDGFGEPDPYWQQIAATRAAQQVAAAAAARDSQVPADGTAPDGAAADAQQFEIVVCASGCMSLLLVGSLLRSLWIRAGFSVARARVGSMSAAPPPRGAVRTMHEEAIRTEEVLPPSARGETRFVFRAAAAIMLGALFMIGVARAAAGNDVSHIPTPLVLAVLVVASWSLRPEGRTLKRA